MRRNVTAGLAMVVGVLTTVPAVGQARFAGQASAPPMQTRSGQVFAAAVPAGWGFVDSTNGVDVTNPATGAGASFALLVNYGLGLRMTPESFLRQAYPMLAQAMPGLRVSALRPAGQQSGMDYASLDYTYVRNGAPMAGSLRIGTLNGLGQSTGMMWAMAAPVREWPGAKPMLAQILLSMTCINPARLAGRDTLIQARNNPNTGLDSIMSSYEYKNKSQNWIDEQWRAVRDGREPDPTIPRPRYPR